MYCFNGHFIVKANDILIYRFLKDWLEAYDFLYFTGKNLRSVSTDLKSLQDINGRDVNI